MSISKELDLPNRRQFCTLACQAASLAAAGTLIGACSSPNSPGNAPPLSTLNGSVSGRVVSVTIPSSGTLASAGSAALIISSLGDFLVSRASDTAFTVLTATCTHADCTVAGFEGSQYVCPCHGSTFTTSGAVVNGPAPRALQMFASTFANGVLTFSA
jgi:cytochrome b6-f complex iron-sulfur subunit